MGAQLHVCGHPPTKVKKELRGGVGGGGDDDDA